MNANTPVIQVIPLLTVAEIRRGIEYWNQNATWAISNKARGAITGAIVQAIKSVGITVPAEIDHSRYLVLGYLTLPESAKLRPVRSGDLTDGQWVGFSRWQSERLANGQYRERPTFRDEVTQVLYRARHDLAVAGGQLPLVGLLKTWEQKDGAYDNWYDLDAIKQMVAKETQSKHKKE